MMLDAEAILEATTVALRGMTGIDPAYTDAFLARNRLQMEGRVRRAVQPLGNDRILLLNMGLGRDSFTMLCLLLENRLIAKRTLVGKSDIAAVVFSDTGYEWKHTYQALPLAAEMCAQAGIRFIHLQKPPQEGEAGWQSWLDEWPERKLAGSARAIPPWRHDPPATIEARARSGYYHGRAPILDDYHSRKTVISLNRQDCSSNHKIAAIRRLIEDLASERYGVDSNRDWGRDVRNGHRRPHLTLIGYAADEGHRLEHDASPDYVSEAYPLMEMGIRKADESAILERWHLGDIRKSGCFVCPFQPVAWYWALREVDPDGWHRVVKYEADALSRNPRMTVLPGRKPLEEAVQHWRMENPDATVEAVLSKAYSRCRAKHAPTSQSPDLSASSDERLEEPCPLPDPLLSFVQARVLVRHTFRGIHP